MKGRLNEEFVDLVVEVGMMFSHGLISDGGCGWCGAKHAKRRGHLLVPAAPLGVRLGRVLRSALEQILLFDDGAGRLCTPCGRLAPYGAISKAFAVCLRGDFPDQIVPLALFLF